MKCLDAVRRTTIVVLPLLSAMGLRANAILPTSNPSCSIPSCSAGAASLTGDLVEGVQLYITNNPLLIAPGESVTLTTSGNLGGNDGLTAGMNLPLAYNFTLDWANSPGAGDVINAWGLVFDISTGASIGSAGFGNPGAIPIGTPITGTSSLSLTGAANPGDLVTLLASLNVNFSSTTGNQLSITIPSSSFDFSAVNSVTPIPEPSSFGFLALGLAALVWISVRNRQPMFRLRRARPETLQ